MPGRTGGIVLQLLLQSTPKPRKVSGRVVGPRALVVNGTEGFREAAQLPEAVLDELLRHLGGVIWTSGNRCVNRGPFFKKKKSLLSFIIEGISGVTP